MGHPCPAPDGLVKAVGQASATRASSTIRATRQDLSATLRIIAAATLVDDRELVTDYVGWFEAVLTGRRLPLAFVYSALEIILGVLPSERTNARGNATSGLEACSVHAAGTQ